MFTAEWYDGLYPYADAAIDIGVWQAVEPVRDEVLRKLEILRQDGAIGSGLDAEVTIQAEPATLDRLAALGDELRFVMITSAAGLAPLGDQHGDAVRLADGSRVQVDAHPSEHAKCVRCWHHRAEVGSHAGHPELCARCIDNVDGDGEERRFA